MTKRAPSPAPRRLIPWRRRVTYAPGKTRRERSKQFRQQLNVLGGVLGLTIVVGLIVILINWQNAGAAKAVSCEEFPHYCAPLAGGAGNADYAGFEAPAARTLDQPSQGAEGVVRGMTADNVPFFGNPAAPIHFRVVTNFACSHCNSYHTTDLGRFFRDYVLTGQATLDLVLVTTTAAPAQAEVASLVAFCAGEQGAFWEMADELYRIARSSGVSAFNLNELRSSAKKMGLDDGALARCASSGRYYSLLSAHQRFMQENGVSGTPTLLVRYGDAAEWTRLEYSQRSYASMVAMTERAHATAQ